MWIYDPPPPLTPPHLANVDLHQYSESFPRERAYGHGRCGALPAVAFRLKYPLGCYREVGHEGPHSALARTAQYMDRKARMKGWRPA